MIAARGAMGRRRRRRGSAGPGRRRPAHESEQESAPLKPEFVAHPALRRTTTAGPASTPASGSASKARRMISAKNKREMLRQIKERKRVMRIDFSAVREMLSPSQVAALHALFRECDVDDSGFLMGRFEISKMLEAVGLPVSELAVSEVLELADCDANSALDFEEFLLFIVRKMSSPYSVSDVAGLFSLFDENNTGVIRVSEFADHMQQLLDGKVPAAELRVVRDMVEEMAAAAAAAAAGGADADELDYGAFAEIMTAMPQGTFSQAAHDGAAGHGVMKRLTIVRRGSATYSKLSPSSAAAAGASPAAPAAPKLTTVEVRPRASPATADPGPSPSSLRGDALRRALDAGPEEVRRAESARALVTNAHHL